MLSDDLIKSIKKMKQLDIVENAALDAEKKAKNDSDYKAVVGDFYNTVRKLKQAVSTLDYAITAETVQYLEESVENMKGIVSTGVVDAETLSSVRQYINRKLNPSLSKEWKDYYLKRISGSLSKLNTLGHLATNAETTALIRTSITNGGEWTGLSLSDDGINSRLFLFKSALDKIDDLEESLNLSEEIKEFIVKVTSRKARVSDVNDNIIDWIKKENLEDRFVINFKS